MRQLTYLLLLFSFVACQNDPRLPLLEPEIFDVLCGRDTLLETSNGIQIKVLSNTINCEGNNTVQLKIQSVLNQVDMIKAQLFTVADNEEILESGGMFKIEIEGGTINLQEAILLNVPAKYLVSGMSSFKLNEEGTWSAIPSPVNMRNMDKIILGESLYDKHCAACHAKDLRQMLTGPALGNVHLHRAPDWLLKFTRNSSAMIAAHDSISLCLWDDWAPVVMPNFNRLSDDEVEAIYQFIAHESKRQDIAADEVEFVVDCDLDITTYGVDTLGSTISSGINIDTTYAYQFSIFDNAWYNLDFFYNIPDLVDPIEITAQTTDIRNTQVYLLFESRNITINCDLRSGKFIPRGTYNKKQVNLPIGAQVYIVAARIDPKEQIIVDYAIKRYRIKEHNNNINITLSPLNGEDFYDILERSI